MAKVDLDSVEHRMSEAQIDNKEIQRVIAALKKELEDAAAARQAQPRIKKYKYIIANTSAVTPETPLNEVPMTVVEAPEDVQWTEILDNIRNAANVANNEENKLKADPLKSIFDTLDRCKAKYLKQFDIKVVSKELPQLIETDNSIDG